MPGFEASLKTVANTIAQAAVSQEGAALMSLLKVSGLLKTPNAPRAIGRSRFGSNAANYDPEGVVGIWERKQENGKTIFVRQRESAADWKNWADVRRIEAKGIRRRIVLIGSSSARGYLYEPQFTPAMALQSMLASQLGKERVEVVDLARTGLQGHEIKVLANSALLLEPDAVVIFSGNSWGTFYFNPDDLPYMQAAMQERGIFGLKNFIEERLAAEVRKMVEDVASCYAHKNVPLVWIVPEFNLGDWRDPAVNAPHFRGSANQEWSALRKRAELALHERNFALASHLAKKMIEIDQEVSVSGLYILSECSRQCGDLDAARSYLERARDALIWDPSIKKSPRPYSVMQSTLRQEATRCQNEIVDLPKLFQSHFENRLPDRTLFLDGCHMSSTGIQIAMAATASKVLRWLGEKDSPWSSLMRHCVVPDNKVRAEAAFLAALVNATWSQSPELVRHYCLEAVGLAPELAQAMVRLTEIWTQPFPMLLCKSAEKVVAMNCRSIQHYLMRHPEDNQQVNSAFWEAMLSALKTAGIDAVHELEQLRDFEHSVSSGARNLLDYYYCSAANQPYEAMWAMPNIQVPKQSYYYKAYSEESRFIFVAGSDAALAFQLTCRLPYNVPVPRTATLYVNSQPLGQISLSHDWENWEIKAPGDVVRHGTNEIVVVWPRPEFPGQAALDTAIRNITRKVRPEFYCAFGEIHSFTVSQSTREDTGHRLGAVSAAQSA